MGTLRKLVVMKFVLLATISNLYACGQKKEVSVPDITASKESAVNPNKELHKHALWNELTKKHVSEAGFVNYKGMIKDSVKLNKYLALLSANHPEDSWTSNERKAYWINAYNAFTVKLIVDNYPIKSIKDLGGSIYRVNTPWDIKFIKIEGKEYHLNDLEHNIIRKQWNDARIHAVLNCAAESCPALRKEAYVAERLDEQLDDQMRQFVNNDKKNIINKDSAKLSKLFKWYSGDFKANAPSIIAYINKYSKVKLNEDAEIDYLDYSWKLNDTANFK
ncbi:MAG: DUF547 domain-containing protein [Brumimicrobium sp.]|nr:DUF547 domain-containing protein [Brumimicrobium sp.]